MARLLLDPDFPVGELVMIRRFYPGSAAGDKLAGASPSAQSE
jgi:hypothetical protein